jgi:hypothetical protein
MHYLHHIFGKETAMGPPEFAKEFEAFEATLPDPKMIAWHVKGSWLPDPNYALDQTETMFYRWWVSMVGGSDQFRVLLQRQEGEALRFWLDVGKVRILARIDWAIDFLEHLPPIPDWNAPTLTVAQRVELKDFAVRYLPSIQHWLSRARILRDSIQSIEYSSYDFSCPASTIQLV